MLWLAVRLPYLMLEQHARGAVTATPLAVAESTALTARLLLCNAAAHASGVRSGMTAASALTLCANLGIVNRNPAAERQALECVAAWACQFTAQVSIAGETELLLETGGSMRFFGGLEVLHTTIERGLQELGYTARLACAPTPLAAQWFVRMPTPLHILRLDELHGALEHVSASSLQHLPATAALERFGIHNIGACLKLPRDGLARRLGQGLLDEIDRALGRLPDPRPLFTPPVQFDSTLTLPAPTAQAEALLFAGHRLYAELRGYLTATGQGAQRLEFTLHHERRPHTRFTLNLVAASRDPAHLLVLLRERLAVLKLPQPATAIRLACTQQQPLDAESHSFLPDAQAQVEAATRLLEKLRARLGDTAIHGLRSFADHRPEHAWRASPPDERAATNMTFAPGERPLWLLPQPQVLREHDAVPQYDGPLTLLGGPERIESGWWDEQPVARDYFVARCPQYSLLWIYRERSANARWFLQGIFS
ncbi:MAG: DNA polymerase Y family protein [Betaproteobacteria bacterium]|nr:DNA polymerase Y family protein [Betaproteobacteria bacterium]MDH5341745.1 DNA polymerase Y family protein [Betaproteobacteria bacterium]